MGTKRIGFNRTWWSAAGFAYGLAALGCASEQGTSDAEAGGATGPVLEQTAHSQLDVAAGSNAATQNIPTAAVIATPEPGGCDTAECCPASLPVVTLTPRRDTYTSRTKKCVVALEGADAIYALGVGSAVLAGGGNDVVFTESNSLVRGGRGHDTVYSAGPTGSVILGNEGRDTIVAGSGNDRIFPGPDADVVNAGFGRDVVIVCSVDRGEVLDGSHGFDELIASVSLRELRAGGVKVRGFEKVTVSTEFCGATCDPADLDDGNPCTEDRCNPETGRPEHVLLPDGTGCSDDNACTENDACQAGECQAGTSVDCNDGNECTDDTCEPAAGCSHQNNTNACSDGNACTTADECANGTCHGGAALNCDDGNHCTDNSCDPIVGCVSANNSAPCDDQDACTASDRCFGGNCKGGLPLNCDDGNICTDNVCDANLGCVSNHNTAPCEDGSLCTVGDICAGGSCRSGDPVVVDDNNPCTIDACDPDEGVTHVPAALGTSCADGDFCNGEEACDGRGSCLPGDPPPPPIVIVPNPCEVPVCEPSGGWHFEPEPPGTSCPDGDLCNGDELCDGAGSCPAGVPVEVDDGDACTVDSCDAQNGVRHDPAPDRAPCDDARLCTIEDTCQDQVCVGTPVVCPPDGECRESGACDPNTGQCVPGAEIPGCGLPPDPATIAPPNDPTIATTLFDSTRFLYEGPSAIQTDVAPGAIVPKFAAVVRGRVLGRDGNGLGGVLVQVAHHPEFGQTVTRADGMYDFVLNGGAEVVLNFSRSDLLPAQRHVAPAWQGYGSVTDVVLISVDTAATEVDLSLSTAAVQVARASPVTDEWGTRRTTMLFASGTTALARDANGDSTPLPGITVRATEYTVGASGPNAMPAELPPNSAYTHAFELSVDEVQGQNVEVEFSQPIVTYVENFLGFPTGIPVPLGYYDPDAGTWVASDNGMIVKIIDVVEGAAVLSILEDDSPATPEELEALGVTEQELQTLGSLYSSDQSLWRMPIPHFSSWDSNWGWGPPVGARPPDSEDPPPNCDGGCDGPTGPVTGVGPGGGGGGTAAGGSFSTANQTVYQTLPVSGTPFSLNYLSSRVPGYTASRTIDMRLTSSVVPAPLKGITVQAEIAGRTYVEYVEPAPSKTYAFTWDRSDAYGRPIYGQHNAIVRVGYVYEGSYVSAPRFGYNGNGTRITTGGRSPEGVMRMTPITLWKDHHLDRAGVGRFNVRDEVTQGLGGWSLSVHHSYDPVGRVLYLGTGGRVDLNALPAGSRELISRGGKDPADGLPVQETNLSSYNGGDVLALPDGTVLYARDHVIWRIRSDSTLWRFAGGGNLAPVEGRNARDAQLTWPSGLARARDGSVVFQSQHRILSVAPDGVMHAVAGTGVAGFAGDDGDARQGMLNTPLATAVGPDGSVYFSDYGNNRVRRVTPEGLLETIAGTGVEQDTGDDGPAVEASLDRPSAIAAAPDGTVYVATNLRSYGSGRVRRISADGTITRFAGGCDHWRCFTTPGAPALGTTVTGLADLTLGPNGLLYFSQQGDNGGANNYGSHNVWRVNTLGRLERILGSASGICTPTVFEGPAVHHLACLGAVGGISVASDSRLYVMSGSFYDGQRNWSGRGLFGVKPQLPGYNTEEIVLPARDGGEQYAFDQNGRHLETRSALTGAVRYAFSYDSSGRLISVRDGEGRKTALRRDADGKLDAIVGPDEHTTSVVLDANGYLSQLSDPEGRTVHLEHMADGLLSKIVDARDGGYQFDYDSRGRLQGTHDAVTATYDLVRTQRATDSNGSVGHEVARTSPEGMQSSHRVTHRAAGEVEYLDEEASGAQSSLLIGVGGDVTTKLADGSVFSMSRGKDEISGASDSPQSFWTSTPGGLGMSRQVFRWASHDASGHLLSAVIDTRVNDRQDTYSTYDAATHIWTHRSAENKYSRSTIDDQERVVRMSVPGIEPILLSYTAGGRLEFIRQGAGPDERVTKLEYDDKGNLATVTDPLERRTSFVHDDAGWLVSGKLPGDRIVEFEHDDNGNFTAIVPPGRPKHEFVYTPVDTIATYRPPTLPNEGVVETEYLRDLDRRITSVERPDGLTTGYAYGAAGRLEYMALPAGNGVPAEAVSLVYAPGTGQLVTLDHSGGVRIDYTNDGFLVRAERVTGLRPTPISLNRGYDNRFRLITEAVEGALTVTFEYDYDNLLRRAGSLTLSRDPLNTLLVGTLLGVVTDARTYNGFAEPATYAASVSGGEVFRTNFTRDKLGRITQKVETIDGATSVFGYTYDLAGRLETVEKDGAQVGTYSYDSNGNRLETFTAFPVPSEISADYDDQDRLLAYGDATFTYTDNGELRTKTEDGEVTAYAYDVLGNLRSVEPPNGTLIEYLVDGRGRRVGKKVNGVLVQAFVYTTQLAPAAELDGSGNIVARFVYGTKVNVPEYIVKGGATYRVVTDHLGSPRLVVDSATGAVEQRMDYDAWGVVLSDTNPGFTPFGFAGGIYDADTGLVRFGARDYDAVVGVWTALEPLRFEGGTSNFTAYSRSDPVNWHDANGLESYRVDRSDQTAHVDLQFDPPPPESPRRYCEVRPPYPPILETPEQRRCRLFPMVCAAEWLDAAVDPFNNAMDLFGEHVDASDRRQATTDSLRRLGQARR